MPKGVTEQALFDVLVSTFGEDVARDWWKWFSVEHRGWGQGGWKRVDAARRTCTDLTPPTGPP